MNRIDFIHLGGKLKDVEQYKDILEKEKKDDKENHKYDVIF